MRSCLPSSGGTFLPLPGCRAQSSSLPAPPILPPAYRRELSMSDVQTSDVLTASVSADALHERPIIGFSPWVYVRPSQWEAQKGLLTWANVKSVLFHLTPKAFSREIDRNALPGQSVGKLPPGPTPDVDLEALRAAMVWA